MRGGGGGGRGVNVDQSIGIYSVHFIRWMLGPEVSVFPLPMHCMHHCYVCRHATL